MCGEAAVDGNSVAHLPASIGITAAITVSPVSTRDLCVVIPAFNEEQLSGRCIQSVVDAGPRPEQIVIVDDCSTDPSADTVERISGVHVLRNSPRLGEGEQIERALKLFSLRANDRYLSIGSCEVFNA